MSQGEFNAGKFRGAVFQMNFVAKESIMSRPKTLRRSNMVSFNPNHASSNLGRLLAGQSIQEALANNKRLHESVNKELIRDSRRESCEITSSADTGEIGLLEVSRSNVGMSSVSLTADPLSYATKLCRLLKN